MGPIERYRQEATMEAAPSPQPPAPTMEDVVTGAFQEITDRDQKEAGHLVVSWVSAVEVINPDGSPSIHICFSDQGLSWPMCLGLAEALRLTVRKQFLAEPDEGEEEES